MKFIFKIIFCIISILSSRVGVAQPSFRIFYAHPAGSNGAWVQPFTSIEVGYQPKFQKYILSGARTSLSLMSLNLKPNPDDSLNYRPKDENQVFLATLGTDFALVNAYSYNIYLGFDYTVGMAHTYQVAAETTKNSGVLGYRYRLGAEYRWTKNVRLVLSVHRQGFMEGVIPHGVGIQEVGLGVRYQFYKS
ncbi:MAG: hypothetical protein RLZZ628_2232 [Bacteroidota bacterium]|jgi:hypothetical protein